MLETLNNGAILVYLCLSPEPLRSLTVRRVYTLVILVQFLLVFYSLQVFSALSWMINIVNDISWKMVPFVLVISLFYLSTVLAMSFLEPEQPRADFFRNAYFWVLFAGVGEEDFSVQWSAVPLVFSGLLVTVLILNVIIAYLSNEFSRLEEKQFLNNWRQKATRNLDFDLVFWVFAKKKVRLVSFWKYLQLKRKHYHKIRTFYEGNELGLRKHVMTNPRHPPSSPNKNTFF